MPIDVQSARIDPQALPAYDPAAESENEDISDTGRWDEALVARQARETVDRIRRAKRPVVMAGTGVRLAKALEEFERVMRRLRIPVTTAWTHDLIASDDELFCGRPGTIGDRAGNFTVQNSDLLLVLGSRLNIRQVSYNWAAFAPRAFKVQVDVDAAELAKPLVRPDLAVHCDLKLFLQALEREMDAAPEMPSHTSWLEWCRERRRALSGGAGAAASAGAAAESILFHGTVGRDVAGRRCVGVRQRHGHHRSLPGAQDQKGTAPDFQFRIGFHGL